MTDTERKQQIAFVAGQIIARILEQGDPDGGLEHVPPDTIKRAVRMAKHIIDETIDEASS